MRRPVGVGLLALASVVVVFIPLTILGYMLTESDDLGNLALTVVGLGAVAAALVWVALRLFSAPG